MDERRRAVIVGSLVVAIASLALLFLITRPDPSTRKVPTTSGPPSAVATTAAPAPTPLSGAAPTSTPSATTAAPTPSSTAPPATLADALKDPDPFAVREAIVAAVARKELGALPLLATVDLSKNAYVATAAIQGVGKLASLGDEKTRHDAVKTLERWLNDETKRGKSANDAIGNTSLVVDALRDTGSKEAVGPLVAALDSAQEPLHIETKIVQALDAMDARSSAPSIERFATRVRARTPTDDLEKELAKEALAAAEATLAKWRG